MENPTTFKAWMRRFVIPAMERMAYGNAEFYGRADVRAMVAAMVHQESKSGRADRPTTLAYIHHNLAGITFMAGDEKHYGKVTLPANEFDTGRWVDYRVYDSFEHSLHNIRWHLLESRLYRDDRKEDCEAWLRAIGPTWCDSNPKHVAGLVSLYGEWLKELAPGK